MEKKEFISKLKAELISRGYAEKTVKEEMVPVGSYFDENGMKDISIPVGDMADEIAGMLNEKGIYPKDDKAADDDIATALRASVSESEAEESDDDVKIAGKAEKQDSEKKDDEEYSVDEGVEDLDSFSPVEKHDDLKEAGFIGRLIVKFKKATAKKEPADADFPADEYSSSDDMKYRILYWVLFAVALPFIILLSLVMIAIYIAFWVLLALLMIAFIAGLIAFVFAGALVALIGIIYGAIMLVSGNSPVGVFEIGLGITVGAAVMFIGILVYNFAIRLIPFAMKMLAKLLGLAFRRGKEGIGAIKRILQNA